MVSQGRQASYREPDLKLFVRDVREGKKRPIKVRSWSTIKDVKDMLTQITNVPAYAIRLYFGPLLTSGRELPNHRTLHDAGIYRSGETLLLDIKNYSDDNFSSQLRHSNDVCLSSSMLDSTPKYLRSLVAQAKRGLSLGLKPDLVLEGSGGTYFLHDARKTKIAVFKPADEEPYAVNNPRGYLRQEGQPMSLREGIVPGEACMREVAAFLLDQDGVLGVPQTTLVEARHPNFNTNGARLNVSQGGAAIGSHSIVHSPVQSPLARKPGSFQEFIRAECTMDDLSPSKISVSEVHKICILDLRLMNADRNAANLLVRRAPDNSLELVPIDHGYCLRSVCDVSWMDWCWLDWPQLKQPLSDKHKKYIKDLDIEADARMLRERLNICEEAVDYFRASSSLLKAGAAAGLTLYDIAILCCRNDNKAEEPSMMEKLFDMASELALVAVENERWHHSDASRAMVEQLSPRRRRPSLVSSSRQARRFSRSVSSHDDFMSLSDHTSSESKADSPGMAQSSASDTSSDNGDESEQKEDCEEWAATLIADLSEHQIATFSRPSRSGSVSSDDGSSSDCSLSDLSSSAKGFWVIPPGSSKAIGCDDCSVQWSPKTTPRECVNLDTAPPLSLDRGKENGTGIIKTPTVTFAAEPSPPFLPPATVRVTEFKPSSATPPPVVPPVLKKPENGGMKRSKSYSALSETAGRKKQMSSVSVLGLTKYSENYDHYRKYFHSFIDLVIVRETTAALHHSKHTADAVFV